jgi:stringent starvation protein B
VSIDSVPQRPYLVRAMHEWMSDTGFTPHLLVDASLAGVDVPRQHVENDKIVLNVSHSATRDLELGNDQISFEARFAGTPQLVIVPIAAVLGIYAKESGEGLVFSDEDVPAVQDSDTVQEPNAAIGKPNTDSGSSSKSRSDHPHLRIIK